MSHLTTPFEEFTRVNLPRGKVTRVILVKLADLGV
jgi:hypothetical protein